MTTPSVDWTAALAALLVLSALVLAFVAHHVLERRRAKQNELEDLQRRTVAAINPHE